MWEYFDWLDMILVLALPAVYIGSSYIRSIVNEAFSHPNSHSEIEVDARGNLTVRRK